MSDEKRKCGRPKGYKASSAELLRRREAWDKDPSRRQKYAERMAKIGRARNSGLLPPVTLEDFDDLDL